MQKQIKHLKKDPVLAKIIPRIKLESFKIRENHFKTLVRAIIGQQLSVKAADTIMKRFENLFPNKKKGQFPTPKQIFKMDSEKMRTSGLSYSKITYLKDLSKKIIDKKIDLENIHKMSDEEIIEHLTQVKGIGRWTAEMFLIFSLAREDIFSYGDLGIRNAIQRLYKLRKSPSLLRAEKISKLWRPYRSLASRYLWKFLELKD